MSRSRRGLPRQPNMAPRFRGDDERGFTLIEVVIALGILGISLTMLLSINATSLNNAGRSRDITIATLLARSKMIDIERELFDEGFVTGTQEDNGDFGEEKHPEIKWASRVAEIELSLDQITGMCDGFGEEGGEGADCESMLGGFGGALEGIMNDIGNSVRMIELTVTWPVGDRFTESLSVKGLVTKGDYSLKSLPSPGRGK